MRDENGRFVVGHPGFQNSGNFVKGHTTWNKGKIGAQQSPRKGKTYNELGIEKEKVGFQKGHPNFRQTITGFKKGYTPWDKGKHLMREHIRKVLHRRPMSSLETKFDRLIQKFKLPFKFVGNGKFFIGRKNPDFVHTGGKRIAIEVFFRQHKELFSEKTLEQWKNEREALFALHGWRIIFLDETQVNEETVKNIKGD